MIEPLFYFIQAPRDRVPRWVTLYEEQTKNFNLYIATKDNQRVCLLFVSNSLDVFNVFSGPEAAECTNYFWFVCPFFKNQQSQLASSWHSKMHMHERSIVFELVLEKMHRWYVMKSSWYKNMHNCILPMRYLINRN